MPPARRALRPDPKTALVEAATALFRQRGYEGVGVAELLALSGAPRGSLYFHFPGGKEQIAVDAMRRASAAVIEGIRKRAAETATIEDYIETACRGWAETLLSSDYAKGCLIALLGLEAGSTSPVLKAVAAEAFESWEVELADMAEAKGLSQPQARRFATAFIGAVEGAIILARTRRRVDGMPDAAAAMIAYVRALRAESGAQATGAHTPPF